MARVKAFQCDGCEKFMPENQRTKQRVTFDGARSGEYERDLCEECVGKAIPEGVDLKARTRKKKAVDTSTE